MAADMAFTPEQHALFPSTLENPPHLILLESADQDNDVESYISIKRHLNQIYFPKGADIPHFLRSPLPINSLPHLLLTASSNSTVSPNNSSSPTRLSDKLKSQATGFPEF